MRTDLKLLYFSLNDKSVDAFYAYIEHSCMDRHYSFRLFERDKVRFKHASDLIFFLDEQEDPGGISVIIDYPSFYGDPPSNAPGIDMSFSVKRAAEIVRRAILKYPEVLFLFDESWKGDQSLRGKDEIKDLDLTTFLFDGNKCFVGDVLKEYHQYDVRSNPFDSISRARSNLFDGSNLRYVIKRCLYNHLQVNRRNFSRVQDSRSNHLALSVEEEHSQNRFNGYALYANGFRVIPVSTARELKWVNSMSDKLKPSLILRDYDLQFPDIDEQPSGGEYLLDDKDGGKKHSVLIFEIDKIRGAKFFDTASYISNGSESDCEKKEKIPKKYLNKWAVIKDNNEYWSNLKEIPVYYVSKGGEHYTVLSYEMEKRGEEFLSFRDGVEKQLLRGIPKPVSGVYSPFQPFKEIRERYNSFALKKTERSNNNDENSDAQGWFIDTGRKQHNHGVPLDIYDLVKSMLERAGRYYDNKAFVRAAIVSSEALEILNGAHEAMMLQAYHILAISENAISMNTIGGSEESLNRDTSWRVDKIRLEVERMMAREGDKERGLLTYNTLNQIFSDCRNYCKEKEHFSSEDCFIRAMGHINEGYTPCELRDAFRRKVDYLKTQLNSLFYSPKNKTK